MSTRLLPAPGRRPDARRGGESCIPLGRAPPRAGVLDDALPPPRPVRRCRCYERQYSGFRSNWESFDGMPYLPLPPARPPHREYGIEDPVGYGAPARLSLRLLPPVRERHTVRRETSWKCSAPRILNGLAPHMMALTDRGKTCPRRKTTRQRILNTSSRSCDRSSTRRWPARPRWPRSWMSSTAHPAILGRCSRRSWRRRTGCAVPTSGR